MTSNGHSNHGMMINNQSNNFFTAVDHGGNVNTTTTTNSTSPVAGGPRSKCDQIVFEALCKACEVVVGSRSSLLNNSHTNGWRNNNNNSSGAYGGSNNNNANNVSATSTRFNLQVPEIPGIRDILSQYRYQLHAVPVRLDVYYQHSNSGRELLERWCFEYRPCASSEKFLEAEGMLTTQKQDAMVQLRHVWKRIVIWLRTLYVFSRSLPTHTIFRLDTSNNGIGNISSTIDNSSNIGFSLYVNGDGTDDVSALVQQQGFLRQALPSGHVTTPYGQLAGHVVYVPAAALQHLSPRASLIQNGISLPVDQTKQQQQQQQQQNYQSQSRPIPVTQNYQINNMNGVIDPSHNLSGQHQQLHVGSHDYKRQLSAPATMMQADVQQRPASYSERSQFLMQQQQQERSSPHHHQQKNHLGTYDPARLIPPRKQDPNRNFVQKQTLHRRSSSTQPIGGEANLQTNSDKPPERVMSGLSLALMMANNTGGGGRADENCGDEQTYLAAKEAEEVTNLDNTNERQHGGDNEKEIDEVKNSSQEKRRAALHQMPPHLLSLEQQAISVSPHHHQPSCSGDYGYAYNTHIPRHQKTLPNNNSSGCGNGSHGHTPQTLRSNSFDSRSGSPSPFSMQHPQNTPPTAAFLGSCHTPTTGRTRSSSIVGANGMLANGLIPPRRSSSSSKGEISLANGGITPPFHDRPIGFLQEASIAQVTGASVQLENDTQESNDESHSQLQQYQEHIAAQQQLASLDLLHSSPFQLQHHEQSSLLSSLLPFSNSGGGLLGAGNGFDSVLNPLNGWASSGLAHGYSSPRSTFHAAENDSYYYEDAMPFAVDLSSSPPNSRHLSQHQATIPQQSSGGPVESSSLFSGGQSATLASLAQKCSAPNHRLKLFESSYMLEHPSDTVAACDGISRVNISNDGTMMQDALVSSLADQLEEFRSFGRRYNYNQRKLLAQVENVGIRRETRVFQM